MSHFTLEQWADLARNVAGSEAATAMKQHLASGCKECAGAFTAMQAMTQAAEKEASYEPPAKHVRSARALMVTAQPFKQEKSWMEIAFDSFNNPAPVGVRGGQTTTRQLLFQKDECCIDVRLEHDAAQDKLTLLGQVLESGEPQRGVASILVEAIQGEKAVASTSTNSFGEFQFQLASPADLSLCFGISSQKTFWMRIPSPEKIPARGIVVTG